MKGDYDRSDILQDLFEWVCCRKRKNGEDTARGETKRSSRRNSCRKKRGVRFGRPPKPRPEEFEQFKAMWLDGKISSRTAAKKLGIAQDTFLRWCRDTKPQEMQVEEALMILRKVSGRLDNEKDGDAIEAIEVVNHYVVENRQKRMRRMERAAKAKMEQTGGDGSESDMDGSTGRISAG